MRHAEKSDREGRRHILLPQQGQTPRTSVSRYPPQCAMQGRCNKRITCQPVYTTMKQMKNGERALTYPMNNFDMFAEIG